MNISFIEDHQI